MLREACYLLCTHPLPKYATNEYIRTYTYDNYFSKMYGPFHISILVYMHICKYTIT